MRVRTPSPPKKGCARPKRPNPRRSHSVDGPDPSDNMPHHSPGPGASSCPRNHVTTVLALTVIRYFPPSLPQLGPSALAGFALFLIIIPLQERVMSFQFRTGKKSLRWTDKRAKIILEVLG